MKRCLICSSPDLNLIDGSSIWSQTITLLLAETGLVHVDFLCKRTPNHKVLFEPLRQHANIQLIDGTAKHFWKNKTFSCLQNNQLFQLAEILNNKEEYDLIIIRGYEVASAFIQAPDLLAKCWVYLTDIPQQKELVSDHDLHQLGVIANNAKRVLYQANGFKEIWQFVAPHAPATKFSLYPPIIPDFPNDLLPIEKRPPRSIYAGKFKSEWKTLEMANHWPLITREIPHAELIMIGDKIHQDKILSDFPQKMKAALTSTENLFWLGALSREQVQIELRQARVGLSWRVDTLDNALEYSTKILEYGAAGCAAILNRNPLHESLLGSDYPLYANTDQEFASQLVRALIDTDLSQASADRLKNIALTHTFSSQIEKISRWLENDSKLKKTILVAGHDLKFFAFLQKKLEATGKFTFLIDKWQSHNKHDENQSKKLLEKADIIFCEWCLGNLVWYSNNKKPDQKLIVRLHAQERTLPYIKQANIGSIDHVSYVSEHIRDEVKINFTTTSVIANVIDDAKFSAHMKMGDASHTLGMIGIVPYVKRIDLAIDTLELLLKKDLRYQLRIKGTHPFDYPWLLNRKEEVKYYMDVMERINSSDLLRYKVIFDPPGDNVELWLTMVSFILSPSDFESFHLSIAEGMLTGSIPIIWNRPGVHALWPADAIINSPVEAAQQIQKIRSNNEEFKLKSHNAREFILTHYSADSLVEKWCHILSNSQDKNDVCI